MNAEKEIKNTNIWTQRKQEMEKKFEEETPYRNNKNTPDQSAVSIFFVTFSDHRALTLQNWH